MINFAAIYLKSIMTYTATAIIITIMVYGFRLICKFPVKITKQIIKNKILYFFLVYTGMFLSVNITHWISRNIVHHLPQSDAIPPAWNQLFFLWAFAHTLFRANGNDTYELLCYQIPNAFRKTIQYCGLCVNGAYLDVIDFVYKSCERIYNFNSNTY